jgi:hypothetical protein
MLVAGICFVYNLLYFYVGSPGVHNMCCYHVYLLTCNLFYYGTRRKVLLSVCDTRSLCKYLTVTVLRNATIP